ncbi:MAG: tetratricopeptide repeat protein, partial [Clostridiales bacterium]
QIIIRNISNRNNNCLKNSIKIIYEYLEKGSVKPRNLLNNHINIDHVLSVSKYGILYNNEFNKSTYCFLKIAKAYAFFGMNLHAEKLFYEIVLMYKLKFGKNYIGIYDIYKELANIYMRRGEYKEADKLLMSTKEIYKEYLGDHIETLKIIGECFSIKLYRKRYNEAESFLEEGIEISKKVYLKKNIKIYELKNKLSLIYGLKGEIIRGIKFCDQILKQKEKIFGLNSFETIKSYNTMAKLMVLHSNFKRAKECYEKVLFFIRTEFGERHEYIIGCYYNLAILNIMNEKYEVAESYLLKLLDIRKKSYYKYCFHTIIIYQNISEIYFKLKKYDKAKVMTENSLEIAEDIFEYNYILSTLYSYLAIVNNKLEKKEEAKKNIDKSIYIRRNINKENSNQILDIKGEIGLLDKF